MRRPPGRVLPLLLLSALVGLPGVIRAQPADVDADVDAASPRLVPTLGLTGGVSSADFSQNGLWGLLGGGDQVAILWDLANLREIRRFVGHSAPLVHVEFFAEDKRILTGSTDGTARVWDTATGQELLRWDAHVGNLGHGSPYGNPFAACDATGWVLTSDDEGTLRVWNSETGSLVRKLPKRNEEIGHIACSDHGRFIAAAGWDGTVVYDASKPRELWRAELDTEPVVFAPGTDQVLTSGSGTLHLREIATGTVLRSWQGHDRGIWGLSLSADGRYALSGSFDRSALLWDLETDREVKRFYHPNNVATVAFDQRGKQFLTGDWSGNVVLREMGTWQETFFPNYMARLHWIGFSENQVRFITSNGRGTAHFWDPLNRRRPLRLEGHSGSILTATMSPDQSRILTGGEDHTASLWAAESGFEIRRFEPHQHQVATAAFSADAKSLVTVGGVAYSWDVMTGVRQTEFSAKLVGFLEADLSPNGRYLAARELITSDLQIFEVQTGEELWTMEGSYTTVRFSPDSELLLVSDAAGDSRLLRSSDGTLAGELPRVGAAIYLTAFSEDGESILIGGSDNAVRVWNRSTGLDDFVLTHDHYIAHGAFSSDGRWVMTGGLGVIHLWDLDRRERLCQMALFSDGSWVVADPSGRFDTDNLDEKEGLGWLLPSDPLRLLPPEIFLREFYEPGLLERILTGQPLPPVPALEELDRRQPEVEIVAIEPLAGAPDHVDVTVEVKPGGSGEVHDLRLFRDGQLVGHRPVSGGRISLSPENGATRFVFPGIALPRGGLRDAVVFSAYAFNQSGVKSSTRRRVHALPDGLEPYRGRAYVISVGVNAFENPHWRLRFAVKDARQMRQELTQVLEGTEAYEEVVSISLVAPNPEDEEPGLGVDERLPTKSNILALLRRLARGQPPVQEPDRLLQKLQPVTPDDLVIFSFSSHGVTDVDGTFYLAPSDVGTGDSRVVRAQTLEQWISSDELVEVFRDVDAGAIVMIVDACHSAATVYSPGFRPGPLGSRGLGQLAYDKGMRILAASQVDDVALESPAIRHGFLTYALIVDGFRLQGSDWRPPDGAITLSEWLSFGELRVPVLQRGAKKARGLALETGSDTHPETFGTARGVQPYFPLGSAPEGPWVQKPELYDFSKKNQDLLLRGQPRHAHLLFGGNPMRGQEHAAFKTILVEDDDAVRAALLYRFLADFPESALRGDARFGLVQTLLELNPSGRELVAACRTAMAHLRGFDNDLNIRIGTYWDVAEALLEMNEELEDGLEFTQIAGQLLQNFGGPAAALESLAELQERLRHAIEESRHAAISETNS